MMGNRMSWFMTLTVLYFIFKSHSSEARSTAKHKLQSAVVVGTVYCDTCFQSDFAKTSHFISGALVAVECDDTNSKPSFRKKVKTNKHGEFRVRLPFSVNKHVTKIKKCWVKLISSSEPYCSVASTATSSSLHLKSRKPGIHIFSAGFFTFKPLTQPTLCKQKPRFWNSKKKKTSAASPNSDPSTFPPPLEDPPESSIIPPIDNPGQFAPIPILPRLPPLPNLPGIPLLPPLPKNTQPSSKSPDISGQKTFGFPPNPFQPPLIPNPFQPPPALIPPIVPSPPTSIFPPIFPSPPPSVFPPIFPAPPSPPPSLFPPVPSFPPFPGFTPPASPPPPPAFPLLPPFPFQPSPGVPPSARSALSKKETRP